MKVKIRDYVKRVMYYWASTSLKYNANRLAKDSVKPFQIQVLGGSLTIYYIFVQYIFCHDCAG
jgi:hypothetical protein